MDSVAGPCLKTTEDLNTDEADSDSIKYSLSTSTLTLPLLPGLLPSPTPPPTPSSPLSTFSQHTISTSSPSSSHLSSLPLFKDTRWIHFNAEYSLSFEYPLRHLMPSTHRMTFKKWSLPQAIKHMLFAYGFSEAVGSAAVPTVIWYGHPLSVDDVRRLKGHQRINHFLNIQSITRKDRLCENIQRMQLLKGFRHFDIIPMTFVLPREKGQFDNVCDKIGGTWIIKPAVLSRGRGIKLIDHPHQISATEPTVISRYIEDPFCINGLKFDLRLYVLITSFDPLRIYLYEEGLGRFASVPYQKGSSNIRNLSMHLTNYSFNKVHSDYVLSTDPNSDNVGNKWSSSAIFRYLKDHGHNTDKLLMAIEDVIIKTIIAGEMPVCSSLRFQQYHGNCFELLGFDILLDKNLRPWILEVNLSPSLNCDTPLDLKIKSKLVSDMFSLVGISLPKNNQNKKNRSHTPYADHKTADPYNKLRIGSKFEEASVLVVTKGEHRRRGGFVRIFPTSNTWELYSSFLESRTKQNYLLHRNLYPNNGRIKWPPNSVGTSLNVFSRFKSSLGPPGPSMLRGNTAAGLSPSQRIETYLRKLHLDCSVARSTTSTDSSSVGVHSLDAGLASLTSDLEFEIIVSVYLKRLMEYLSALDAGDCGFNGGIEKLMSLLTKYLMASKTMFIVPEQFLSPSVRLRMIIQQLKDFIPTNNEESTSSSNSRRDLLVKFLNYDVTKIEEIILSYGTSSAGKPFINHLIELVKCVQHQRRTHRGTDTPTTNSSRHSTTKRGARCISARQLSRKSSGSIKAMARPHSANSFKNSTLHITGMMHGRGIETEESTELTRPPLEHHLYNSLPCKLPSGLSLDFELCDNTNRVISAALQRLSTRQSTRETNRHLIDSYH